MIVFNQLAVTQSIIILNTFFFHAVSSSEALVRPIISSYRGNQYEENQDFHVCLVTAESTSNITNCDLTDFKVPAQETSHLAPMTQTPLPHICTLYIAKSTIPGAGLGFFTGIERLPGDLVGDGDVLIPVIDTDYHLLVSRDIKSNSLLVPHSLDPFADYCWQGAASGEGMEGADCVSDVSAFSPGLDSVINCHLGVENAERSSTEYHNAGLHRSRDPGTGAFTPYYNQTTLAKAYIPAGGEIFKSYGDDWFLSRNKMFGNIPLHFNYERAEQLIRIFNRKIESRWSSEIRSDLWSLIANFPMPSRTIKALPHNYSQLAIVLQQGIRGVYQPAATRDLRELETHGQCADGIRSGPSTLPQAGHGAFAQRHFSQGSVVVGTPLLFTHTEDVFRMYDGNWFDKEPTGPDEDDFYGYQLVLNYCLRHVTSDFYLCPYGFGVNLINHNQTRANVRLQWADDGFLGHQAHWLTKSPLAMKGKYSPGLFMNYVATRDIPAGEEIFLDYGDDWETAWQRHVREFEQNQLKSNQSSYVSARDWNKAHSTAVLRTKREQENDPYPDHMESRCLVDIHTHELTAEDAVESWKSDTAGVECTIVKRKRVGTETRYQVKYQHKHENDNDDDDDDDDDDEIIETHKYKPGKYKVNKHTYANEYETDDDDDDDDDDLDNKKSKIEWFTSDWIVREAIRMFDVPYTSDIFMDGVFRHPMGLADDLTPDVWKNYNYYEMMEH